MVLFCLMVGVAMAAISILFSQTMKEAALKRFHLASRNFSAWAIHQMVPAMYNFENRIKFSNVIDAEGDFDAGHRSYLHETVNHFPARFITFGDQRHVFANGRQGMFEMTSTHGDTTLISRWELIGDASSKKIHIQRVFEQFQYSASPSSPGPQPSENRRRSDVDPETSVPSGLDRPHG